MNKLIKASIVIGLIALAIAISSVLIAGQLVSSRLKQAEALKTSIEGNPTSTASAQLTTAMVAMHATSADCWMIISGNVYNLTSFLIEHPGGAAVMTGYCGKDATVGFETKGKKTSSPHSQIAIKMLERYFLGSLGESVTNLVQATPTPTSSSQPTNIPTPASPQSSGTTLTVSEVASHNTPNNCWIIINTTVYNVTPYLTSHPGGVSVITKYCGQNATTAFTTKGGKGSNHSSAAYTQLNKYVVGSTTDIPAPISTLPAPENLPKQVKEKYPTASIVSSNYEDDGRAEIKIDINGECRSIKIDSNDQIIKDERC